MKGLTKLERWLKDNSAKQIKTFETSDSIYGKVGKLLFHSKCLYRKCGAAEKIRGYSWSCTGGINIYGDRFSITQDEVIDHWENSLKAESRNPANSVSQVH